MSDIVVEVRDKGLARKGVVPANLLNVKVSPVLNGLGSWTLSLPADHALAPVLSTPGAGIIVTGPTDVILSGPVTAITKTLSATDPGGTVEFSGVDDSVILADTLCFPDPTNPDPTTQTKANDVRTGNAESLMQAFVSANVGPAAPASSRKRSALTLGANLNRGPTLTKSPRFQVLGDLLNEIALVAGLSFRIVQRGNSLVFEVNTRTDRSPTVRLDVLNGSLSSQEVTLSPPGVTQAIVAGQGDGTDRQFVTETTAASLADSATWGRWIEVWIDQRQTNVIADLQQAGNEALAASGFMQVVTKAVPVDDTTMRLGYDWFLGDTVAIVSDGVERTSYISGYNIVADPNGVKLGVILGEAAALSQAIAHQAQTDDLSQRVSKLESASGSAGATGWAAAALINGWVNSGGSKQTLRYRRAGNGFIEVQGVVKGGTGSVFTLPYHPNADLTIPIVTTGAPGFVTITAGGDFIPTGTLTGDVAFQVIFGTTN